MFTKDISKTYLVQVAFSLSEAIGYYLLFFYLYQIGHSFLEIISQSILFFSMPILYILFAKSFKTRNNIFISFGLGLIAYFIVYSLLPSLWLYVFAILRGFVLIFFYLGYNINIFSLIKKEDSAFSAGIYYSIFYILGIILPALAGFIAESFGIKKVFIVGAILLVLPAYFATRIKNIRIDYKINDAVKSLKKVNILIFIEGIWESVPYMAIGLYTLYFLQTPMKYGLFFSYLSFVGVIATLIFTKISDKLKKRTIFIYPLSVLLGIFTLFLFFAHDFQTWAILTGILGFLSVLTFPFMITVVLDKQRTVAEGMISRELFLNLGRVLGSIFLSLAYYFSIL